MLHLGYACINTELSEKGISTNKSMILKTMLEKGPKEAKRIALNNLDSLMEIFKWNEEHGIRLFRITSDWLPHYTNPRAPKYTLTFAKTKLAEIGKFANNHNHQIGFHPGNYSYHIGSPTPDVVQQCHRDLKFHADTLDLIGCRKSLMVIHIGGVYGDREKTLIRWKQQFNKLSPNIKKYVVIENDEFSWGAEEVVQIAEDMKIPMVFDFFHHSIKEKTK